MRPTALVMSQSQVTTTVAGRSQMAVVVAADGEVDASNRAAFLTAVARAAAPLTAGLLVLDLTRVVHIKSAGLSAAEASLRGASGAGWGVAMVVGSPWLLRRCAITGVDQQVAVFTCLDAALTSGGRSWGGRSA